MQSMILFAAALMGAAVNGFVLPRETKATDCGSTSNIKYTVVKGDTLTSIAKKFKSGICNIVSVNKLANPNLIELGATLIIPENCSNPDNKSCVSTPAEPTETCVPGLPGSYTIVSGDTLTNISQDFNITLDSLIAANTQIENPDAIDVGQIITVPVCPSSQCEAVGTYNIVAGDLFVDLAATYHTTIGQIKALNNNVNPSKLKVGQQIILPQDCKNVTTAVA
nr:extracellular protein 6 [Fulvia fulva]